MEGEQMYNNNVYKVRVDSENSHDSSTPFYQEQVALSKKSAQKIVRKYLCYAALVIIAIAILVWTGLTYLQERNDFAELDRRLKIVEHGTKATSIDNLPKKSLIRKEDDSFISIKLCGDGHKKVNSTRGKAYINWKKKISAGDIEYNKAKGYINIKVTGTYYIYAQMYLFENQDSTPNTLEFHIKDSNGKILTLSAVPKSSCVPYCTQSISSIVKLKEGDSLLLTSYIIGVQFYMACDKAQFGMYMLKKG